MSIAISPTAAKTASINSDPTDYVAGTGPAAGTGSSGSSGFDDNGVTSAGGSQAKPAQGGFFGTLLGIFGSVASGIGAAIKKGVDGMFDAVGGLLGKIPLIGGLLQKGVDFFKGMADKVLDFGQSTFTGGLTQAIGGIFSKMKDGISNFFSTILGNLFGSNSGAPK